MITTVMNVYLCDWRDTSEVWYTLNAAITEPLPAATHLEMVDEAFHIEADKTELKKTSSGWVTTIHAYKLCTSQEADALKDKLEAEAFKVVP